MTGVIQELWQVESLPAGDVRIYPDGCQDIIWVKPPQGRPYWKTATLDARMRVLSTPAGVQLWAARLGPGARIDPALFHELRSDCPDDAAVAIAALCTQTSAVYEWLAAARSSPAGRVAGLARGLGVSARTLQRQVKADTGQGPLFWLRMLRLRRALGQARAGLPLAEAAADAGFADQAHFTREAVAFHAATPARLLRDERALSAILAPGL